MESEECVGFPTFKSDKPLKVAEFNDKIGLLARDTQVYEFYTSMSVLCGMAARLFHGSRDEMLQIRPDMESTITDAVRDKADVFVRANAPASAGALPGAHRRDEMGRVVAAKARAAVVAAQSQGVMGKIVAKNERELKIAAYTKKLEYNYIVAHGRQIFDEVMHTIFGIGKLTAVKLTPIQTQLAYLFDRTSLFYILSTTPMGGSVTDKYFKFRQDFAKLDEGDEAITNNLLRATLNFYMVAAALHQLETRFGHILFDLMRDRGPFSEFTGVSVYTELKEVNLLKKDLADYISRVIDLALGAGTRSVFFKALFHPEPDLEYIPDFEVKFGPDHSYPMQMFVDRGMYKVAKKLTEGVYTHIVGALGSYTYTVMPFKMETFLNWSAASRLGIMPPLMTDIFELEDSGYMVVPELDVWGGADIFMDIVQSLSRHDLVNLFKMVIRMEDHNFVKHRLSYRNVAAVIGHDGANQWFLRDISNVWYGGCSYDSEDPRFIPFVNVPYGWDYGSGRVTFPNATYLRLSKFKQKPPRYYNLCAFIGDILDDDGIYVEAGIKMEFITALRMVTDYFPLAVVGKELVFKTGHSKRAKTLVVRSLHNPKRIAEMFIKK